LIQRGTETIVNPEADDRLLAQDQVLVLGTPEVVDHITQLFGREEENSQP
jgi:Trk K+ transport system NAD-binding subunit